MAQVSEDPGPQLCMQRPSLDDLPGIELPAGYRLRTSQKGDAAHWARIIRESFDSPDVDASRFARDMQSHPAYRPDRIFFVCAADGMPCATASAYRKDAFGGDVGYLHMVGVRPCHAGRKLGLAASLAALHRFRSEGLSSAVLETDDFRLAAVKTYFRLGFLPLICHESHPARWDAVCANLGMRPAQEEA